MNQDIPLDGFELRSFSHNGKTRAIYAAGSGPGVIVIHEAPGITPLVAAFARRVVEAGFSVRMPSLFGTPGKVATNGYTAASVLHVCVSREFTKFALDRTSPVINWLRAFAAEVHKDCGGSGVGAIGMCMTGGFALGMTVDDIVRAPVLSQPSLPFPTGTAQKAAPGVSNADLARIRERVRGGACVMGLRFSNDAYSPADRFATLKHELGEGFIAVEIDSSPGNPWDIPQDAHSVLTNHFVDRPGHPTREALDRVLAFFKERLAG